MQAIDKIILNASEEARGKLRKVNYTATQLTGATLSILAEKIEKLEAERDTWKERAHKAQLKG